MSNTKDKITMTIEKVITESKEPLETKEVREKIQKSLGDVSRSKVLYRLNDLRGQGEIAGKFVGSGKGVWIWWKKGNSEQEH
jgi:repressor of nif and glnA expression